MAKSSASQSQVSETLNVHSHFFFQLLCGKHLWMWVFLRRKNWEDVAISSTCATWVRRLCMWSLMLGALEVPVLEGGVGSSVWLSYVWWLQPCMSRLRSEGSCTEEMFPDQNDSLAEAGLRPYYFETSSTCPVSSTQSVPERLHGLDDFCSLTNTWTSLPSSSFHMLKLLTWHPNINGKCLFLILKAIPFLPSCPNCSLLDSFLAYCWFLQSNHLLQMVSS